MKTITITVDEETYEFLKKECENQERSLNSLLRYIIKKYKRDTEEMLLYEYVCSDKYVSDE